MELDLACPQTLLVPPKQMRLFFLTSLTMTAFAANSVLNRGAINHFGMDPVLFAAIRLSAGALVLFFLTVASRRSFNFGGWGRLLGVGGLLVYIFGFSLAYLSLDAGIGALILFGVVHITMFAGAVFGREELPSARWVGAALGFVGLTWLLWPKGPITVSLTHAYMMALAGIGWGVYSLQGRRERDALQATALNFLLATPIGIGLAFMLSGYTQVNPFGIALAVASGGLTSAMGYVLWYRLIPVLGASRAAVAQLSVPVIAFGGGTFLLNEPLTLRFLGASILVIGGVLVSMRQ